MPPSSRTVCGLPTASSTIYNSSKRRAMSEAKTRKGSTLRRTAIHSSMRGYMAWKVSAVVRESLAV
ncbi:hypothetical protein I552_3524 [Mycobacterium xenopi 3993]|nr:hypothetical protein I552_3524 [Mycobacterium xenopi 3993]